MGCKRTAKEIGFWTQYNTEEKRNILIKLETRLIWTIESSKEQ